MQKKRLLYKDGFTLIEVLLCLMLICVLSALVLPNFKNTTDNLKLSVAVQKLYQDVKLAQQKAISEGRTNKILFDTTKKNNYLLIQDFQSVEVKLPEDIYIDWTNFDSNTLIFYASGAPAQAGTVAIKNKNKKLYVIVSVATGRVRISEKWQ